MKRLTEVLTAVLLAVMMMTVTGCSKEEESMEEKIVQDMKQHIVGTWEHDGDFVCKDLSELSGTVKDGIIYGCNSTFDNYNPATLTLHSDESFDLEVHGHSKVYSGKYFLETSNINGEPRVYLRYDDAPNTFLSEWFGYTGRIFFEEDYKTVYLVAYSWATLVGRYRRE